MSWGLDTEVLVSLRERYTDEETCLIFFVCFGFILCVWDFVHMHVLYTMYVPGIHRDQKKMQDPLELELQVIMGHLVGAENWREVLWKKNQGS